MAGRWVFFVIAFAAGRSAVAQHKDVARLFADETPVVSRLSYSMAKVAKNTNDTIYSVSTLSYKNADGSSDSLKIGVRARGNFRRKNCFFAPLKLKLKKGETKGTLFESNKSLKLVLPCRFAPAGNDLIMKEYICYKLYEVITKYSFKTRLTNVVIADVDSKQKKDYPVLGFFIEDDDLAAKRWNGKMVDSTRLNPFMLQDTSSLRHAFFQCMIANTDWSHRFFHNTKIVRVDPAEYIPIAYDFDMCGLVDPAYAVVNEELDITSVRDRLYRGYCRNDALTQIVREEFLRKEAAVMETVDHYAWYFKPKDIAEMKKYLGEFFTTLKSDKRFKEKIVLQCRKK